MRTEKADALTRRQLADLLGLHQDSVSRALPDGLASAVLEWGGRGRTMRFSRALALRWDRARSCHRGDAGRPCLVCRRVLEDVVAVAEHLIAAHHGYGGCRECRIDWPVCQPCVG
ncbi:MAG: hypothetical protein WBD07_18255 [Vicinamibacterales bacterium]